MKVSIAARILSHTVAATIEEMVSNPKNNLPSQAIDTAEFVHDMDQLFDSFNGRTPKPECGKPYRRCLSDKSPHFALWNKLLPKINSWEFISPSKSSSGSVAKSRMPFKTGWLTTINATKELWSVCRNMGFKFLRTRSLNPDPLENQFSSIRHFGAENTNPNCYQFVSCFKTSVLNNLVTPVSNRNCEMDGTSILDNLQSFLNTDILDFVNLKKLESNEIENIILPSTNFDFTDHDANTCTYAAGFLIKKIKLHRECKQCAANLLSETVEPQHMFVLFKEFTDNKKSLFYVTKEISYYLAQIHDCVFYILPKYGYISYLKNKIKIILKSHLDFNWYTCVDHKEIMQSDILVISIELLTKKYYDDISRNFKSDKKNRQDEN
ncbi:unnamed protein product [Ceutorhynchus assimilis]|uniref:Transposable element P transposase n=1 Tax=Ceutorhynchus assimilis TaxID=467358 RepID=A0A9N9MU13_9CUCU|nr:unnamed protein product [Ceutorhynchus assimilis]